MAEPDNDKKYILDYVGLEILLNTHLTQLKYKSDLAILIAHYILTTDLGYDCVEITKAPYSDDISYEILDRLPSNWNQDDDRYKLFYKNKDNVKIISGLKKKDSFVLYVLKENGDRDRISEAIQLNSYIPDDFFNANHSRHKDFRLIQNVDELMNILTTTIVGNSKIKDKQQLDEIMVEPDKHIKAALYEKEESHGILQLPRHPLCDDTTSIGNFHLQDPKKHVPSEENRIKDFKIFDHPDFYMQEDLEGEPTSSIYS